MLNRRDLSASTRPLPIGPHCQGGVSSLLRMGLGAAPRRLAPVSRLVAEQPLLLRRRPPSRQLDLFGPVQSSR